MVQPDKKGRKLVKVLKKREKNHLVYPNEMYFKLYLILFSFKILKMYKT